MKFKEICRKGRKAGEMTVSTLAKKAYLPFRMKIVALNAGSLIFALGCILLVGAHHIVDDKTSYILDFNFYRVRSTANAVENQLVQTQMLMRLMHTQNSGRQSPGIEHLFQEGKNKVGLRRMLILELTGDGQLVGPDSFGDRPETLIRQLDILGWSAPKFKNSHVLLGKSGDNELVIGTLVPSKTGQGGTVYVTFLAPQLSLSEGSKRFEIHLVDNIGTPVVSKFSSSRSITDREFRDLMRPILDTDFESGAKTWETGSGDFIVGYQRLKFQELIVVGLIPHRAAFGAVQGLVLRSLVLGLSILSIAIGLTLLLANKTTSGLKEMMRITEQVARGVFRFRVDLNRVSQDEFGSLAGSFNTMADKIDQLMQDTVAKTETKREIETVQTLQTQLYPDRVLTHANFAAAGMTITGKICGGDWWNYAMVREYAIFVVAKVGGSSKGLNAALLTAAAHGAFSTFIGASKLMARIPPSMKLLISNLNTAIFEASRSKGTLHCFVSILNTETGELQVVNCGIEQPWIHRIGFGGAPEQNAKRFSRIGTKKSQPLGQPTDPAYDSELFQLEPEDVIFLCSPGFFDIRNLKGARVITPEILYDFIGALFDHFGAQADRICKGIFERAASIWGKAAEDPPDDISFLVISVPKKAYFLKTKPADVKEPKKVA